VRTGAYDEALRRVADQLSAEFTDPDVDELPSARRPLDEKGGLTGLLGVDDEALVARLREVLAGIAATLGAGNDDPPAQAIETVLNGSEFVFRNELAVGNAEGVLKLMPGCVYLVAVMFADQDRALELSRRTAQLTEQFAPRS
jgi:hypothetical protein